MSIEPVGAGPDKPATEPIGDHVARHVEGDRHPRGAPASPSAVTPLGMAFVHAVHSNTNTTSAGPTLALAARRRIIARPLVVTNSPSVQPTPRFAPRMELTRTIRRDFA